MLHGTKWLLGIYFLLLIIFVVQIRCFAYQANTHLLPRVVVSAKSNGASTTKADAKYPRTKLAKRGVTNLIQALSNLDGLILRNITADGSQVAINLRGFGSNAGSNALLLIDDIPFTNPDLSGINLNLIPWFMIKEIEVINGSEGVRYGDQAVGGVINLHTNQTLEMPFELTCASGSYATYNCNLVWHKSFSKLAINLGALVNQSDNYRDHNASWQNQISGIIQYKNISDVFKLTITSVLESVQYPGALNLAQVNANPRQAINEINYFKDANEIIQLHYLKYLPNAIKLVFDIGDRFMSGSGVLFSDVTQHRDTLYLNVLGNHRRQDIKITIGGDLESDRYDLRSDYGTNQEKQMRYGLFGEIESPIYKRVRLIAGARGAMLQGHMLSTNDFLNRAFVTNIGVAAKINDYLKTYLRRAESFRFPKADENANSACGVNLRTQSGVSFETGINYKVDQRSLSLDLYRLNIRDEIAFDSQQTPSNPFGANRNLSPTLRYGMNLMGNINLTPHLPFEGSYQHFYAKYIHGNNAGKDIPLVPHDLFRLAFMIKLHDNIFIYPYLTFTNTQYAGDDDLNNGPIIPATTVYNLNIRYEKKYLSFNLKLDNLSNKKYFYSSYQSNNENYYYPAPGRNFLLTATARLA